MGYLISWHLEQSKERRGHGGYLSDGKSSGSVWGFGEDVCALFTLDPDFDRVLEDEVLFLSC